MKNRRGSLLSGTTFGDAILMYKPGDVVKPVTVMDQFFTGVVRSVDQKTNKVTVAWGGGPESQHDVDELMPMPFFDGKQTNSNKVSSVTTRRMRADVEDLLVDTPPAIDEETKQNPPESTAQSDFVPVDMEALLNRQVGSEFYSAYLYYMVAAVFQSKGLVGFQHWMETQGDGEIDHAMKVYKYLVDTGSVLDLPVIPSPKIDAAMDVVEITRLILDHEMRVTQDWNRIGQLTKLQNNPATDKLVQEFLTEQIEEEDAALTLHQRVQMADSGSGILMIDNDLKDRGPVTVASEKDQEVEDMKASVREAAFDGGDIVLGTSGDEPPAQRSVFEETAKISSENVKAAGNIVDQIMRYEGGEMDEDEMVKFFQELIDTGKINHLQGSYQRTAQNLINQGLCHRRGQTAAEVSKEDWKKALAYDEECLEKVKEDLKTLEGGGAVENLTLENAKKIIRSLEDVVKNKRKMLGLVASTEGMKSRRAMYWCGPERTYRLTQQEQEQGSAVCPKCKVVMQVEPFTKSDKLMICPECRFKIPTSKAVKNVEVKVPEGVSVTVTEQDSQGEDVCSQEIMAGAGRSRRSYADPTELEDLPRMSLSQIASLVYKDWKSVNYGAKPYLSAMTSLQNISDMYGQDSGSSVVAYFLSNATSWRGEVAKAVKKELNRRLKH